MLLDWTASLISDDMSWKNLRSSIELLPKWQRGESGESGQSGQRGKSGQSNRSKLWAQSLSLKADPMRQDGKSKKIMIAVKNIDRADYFLAPLPFKYLLIIGGESEGKEGRW